MPSTIFSIVITLILTSVICAYLKIRGLLSRDFQRVNLLLAKTENNFNILLSESYDGVVITSIDGTIVDANQKASLMFGESVNEMIGQSCFDFFVFDPKELKPNILDITQAQKGASISKLAYRKKNGEVFSRMTNIISRYIAEEPFQQLIFVIHDTIDPKTVLMQERDRLARDLHDTIPQSLYSLSLFANGAQDLVSSNQHEQALEYLEQIGLIANQSIKEMRMFIYELQPPIIEKIGLVEALQRRLKVVEQRAGMTSAFIHETNTRVSEFMEKELYSIAIEVLNNSIQHSEANSISIRFYEESHQFVMEIADDGIGFDINEADNIGGMGLKNIQSRAAILGGQLVICSQPNAGTEIKLIIPLNS